MSNIKIKSIILLGLLGFFSSVIVAEETTSSPDPIPYEWYENGIIVISPVNDEGVNPYPIRQIFDLPQNTYSYSTVGEQGFLADNCILANSYGTLEFPDGENPLNGAIHNNGLLRIQGNGAEKTTVQLTDGTVFTGDEVHTAGSIWLDKATLVWNPTTYYEANPDDTDVPLQKNYADNPDVSEPQLRFYSLFGNGKIVNESSYRDTTEGSTLEGKNVTLIEGMISPSYWDREKVVYVDENGDPLLDDDGNPVTNTVAVSGQTLTFSSPDPTNHVLHIGEDGILAPIVFRKEATQGADKIEVEGSLHLDKKYYIQPTLAEGLKEELLAGNDNTPDQMDLVTTTEGITFESEVRQQYAWGDASVPASDIEFDNEDDFSSPVVYRINYDNDKITLTKAFTWAGNYLKQIQSTTTDLNENIREMAWQMNEMLYMGVDEISDEGDFVYMTDDPFFLGVASIQDPRRAAYHIKQMTPEVYATRMTLTALNGIKQGDIALEQMSNARQHQGIRSRLGRCGDGDCPDTVKRQHFDPFFAQFHGNQSWYAWATPMGQWMERDTDGLLSGFFGYEYQQYGFNAGIARNLGSVTLGISGGYQDGRFSARDTWHEIDVESFQIMFLASWYCGNWWADGWFGYNRDSDDSLRAVLGKDWENQGMDIVGVNYTLQGWSGGFHLGYNWNFGSWLVTPSVGFRFGTARNAGFQEEETHLTMKKESLGMYELPIGVRAAKCFTTSNGWLIVPMVKAEWIARFGDQAANLLMDYYGYQSYIYGAEIPSEFHYNLKINFLRDSFQFGAEYDGSLAKDYNVHRAGLTMGFVF